jgi:hypothetical protein
MVPQFGKSIHHPTYVLKKTSRLGAARPASPCVLTWILLAVPNAERQAPGKAVGKGEPGPIPNQRPIAARAGSIFREDFLAFFDCYGRNQATPRLSLLPMLEAAIGIGVSTVLLSSIDIIERWLGRGEVPTVKEQAAWPIFIDCSGSADPALSEHE